MILIANSDYFLKQRQQVELCNGEVWYFLCGTGWIIKYYLDEFRASTHLESPATGQINQGFRGFPLF
jgi:hypothetical protein